MTTIVVRLVVIVDLVVNEQSRLGRRRHLDLYGLLEASIQNSELSSEGGGRAK